MCRGAPMNFSRYTSRRTERRARFRLRLREQPRQFLGPLHDAHAAPAAARRRFQNDRIPDFLRQRQRLLRTLQHARRAGQHRHAHLAHEGARPLLDAHQPDHFRLRADELDARGLADLRELGILAQKAVAGMDRVDVGDLRRADDRRDIQIAARALGRSDADRLVGESHVRAVAVGLGIDGHGLDSQFLTGADDANRDFAAIGDEDFLKPYGWQTEPPRTPPAVRSARACSR